MTRSDNSINLLLVDDSIDNIQAIELALESTDVNIFSCTSPYDALQICIKQNISIALIDVHMPGMDGYELLEKIKGNPLASHILVILITGYSMASEDIVKGLNKGAVDYLFKPLDLHITIAKVNSLIALVTYQMEIQRSKRQKEIFLANMSHEIRTPLNSINGLIHLLKDTGLDAGQTELISLMEYASKTLLGIVNDVLESSKIDAGKIKIVPSEINLTELIENVCEMLRPLADEKGLALSFHIADHVPSYLFADPIRLSQVLINVINNAIKFTNEGKIQVNVKVLDKKNDKVQLEFTIEDTGIGIPAESINKIFNRFEQIEENNWQKFGGTGLGLSIVKKIIELNGGTFKIESIVNKGTKFIFQIWFTLAKNVKLPKVDNSNLSKFEHVRLLLAEDNSIAQRFVLSILKKWHISVDTAVNGLEAFEKTKYNNYDVILMDTHMPVMNGYEAAKKIRSELSGNKADIPIISFSASVTENERKLAFAAGMNDFIEKPFDPAKLHYKIKKIISQKMLLSQE